jgi:ATP-binding cassette, subfamily B, bacterial
MWIKKIGKKTVETFFIIVKTLPIFWKASALYTIILLVLLPIQGILPALNVWISKQIVDEISTHQMMGFSQTTLLLLMSWILTAYLNSVFALIIMTVQGLLTDKTIVQVNQMMMKKSSELLDLNYFEDHQFYDDIQMIQQGAAYQPLNLLVYFTEIIRALITTISMFFLLLNFHFLIAIIVIISLLPQSIVTYKLFREIFDEMISRSPVARRMKYYSSILLSNTFAKEIRILNLSPFFMKRYSLAFETIHKGIKKVRIKQMLWSSFFVVFEVLGCGFSFWWVINGALKGNFSYGETYYCLLHRS